ncbi:MAG: type IV secretory system conjugative DNA transfer family protein [Limisphaerales bacterium]
MNEHPEPRPTVTELLTRQFYDWEMRGRGWAVYPEPVDLEPPFRQFLAHYVPRHTFADDGLVETGLSRFAKRLLGAMGQKEEGPALPPPLPETEDEPAPQAITPRDNLVELQTFLPATLDIPRESFDHFLSSLHLCREPVTFELLGTTAHITAQLAVHRGDAPLVRQQLQAFFPDAVFLPRESTLEDVWTDGECAIVEFGLGKEFMLPLAAGKLDPFVGITGALAELDEDELGLFQVMFQPVRSPWAESIIRAVTDNAGEPFFMNAPELLREAREKVSAPLHAAVVRIATQSPDFDRAWEIARNLAGSLRVFASPSGNELIPLTNDEYPFADHVADVLRRQCRRSGMVLNSEELIGFVHLPSAAVRVPALGRQTGKTKPAPKVLQERRGVLLGHNVHAGKTVPVMLAPEQRVRHCHLIGASGTGKSTLLYNLIRQDIENGEGVAVLDPHGDLVDRVLGIIPEERIKDVVLLDPSDEAYSIGFNILSAHSDLEKRLLASDLVSVFERLSTSWGDQMASVLQNAILAFLESSRGGTLADLRRFLLEPDFRKEFLETVQDSEVLYYWQKGFAQLSGNKSIGPVITRLETFLSPKPIRYMVSQKENRLDFADILDTGKIFLAKLSQGLVGRENSYLLGTLLVAKLQQLVMSRQAQQAGTRKDFWCYIDEFHNFITPSMAEILGGARKYRIGLILAHQELRQLDRNSDVASAVLSNPYTRVVFRVGDDDARKLAQGFASFEARDLQNLGTGEAVCRLERSDYDCNLTVPLPEEIDETEAAERRRKVIEASRQKYGTPRAEIESVLAAQARHAVAEPAPAKRRPKPEQPKVEAAPQVPPAIPPVIAEATKPAEPVEPGAPVAETEIQHQAIVQRIIREAESLDYVAFQEKIVLDGRGRVDLALERGGKSIACEISVTTPVDYELGNIRKCFDAGFGHVAVICADKRKLASIRDAAAPLAAEHKSRIGFYAPDAFLAKLREWARLDPDGGKVEGSQPRKRKVRLQTSPISEAEREQREASLFAKLAAMMKGKGGAS